MPLYRIYAPIPDEFGQAEQRRVGRTYVDIKKAIATARKASALYGVAELKDDARSIYDRLLSVFRDGREVAQRPQF